MGEEGEEDIVYTKDGTTDLHGNPAIKKDTGNWRACPYILGTHRIVSLCNLSLVTAVQLLTNLVNYMKDRLHQGNATAANNVTYWSGTCYVMPLLGAFIADAYAGRYWTIASFMIIYILVRNSHPYVRTYVISSFIMITHPPTRLTAGSDTADVDGISQSPGTYLSRRRL
ncbi:hypothetical protein GW17_00012063 [Ensete ventricosum]|nr:hypothetical protein GW17_00012063 [Ensete ventricosum]